MPAPIPILIVSDAVSSGTGLGRIARDLASRIHANLGQTYRVATFGYGGPGDCRLGFPQFVAEGMDGWILPTLPQVWDNFAGDQKGLVLFIWDPLRLAWFAQPESSQMLASYPGLQSWLANPPFRRIVYCPIDSCGPNGRLAFPLMKTLLGFDGILAYTEWGRKVIARTIGEENALSRGLESLPHGIDGFEFSPSTDRGLARSVFPSLTGSSSLIARHRAIADDEVLIGAVGTNQPRKDWHLVVETAAILSRAHKVRLWIHTDTLQREWDLVTLLIDYGLLGSQTLVSTGHLPDAQMADAYSACDATIGMGLGEGFGFPILESLFCGTPCVHGNYGGGAEILRGWPDALVEPVAYRYEGCYASKRPVFRSVDFAAAIERMIGKRTNRPAQYDWENLWPYWEAWFRKQVAES